VSVASICGTDVKVLHRKLMGQPDGEFVMGHEYAGTVAALGPGVDEVAVGDRVAVEVHKGCERCENCVKGWYTSCLNYGNVAKGHRAKGLTCDGGFAEYAVNHINTLYRLPASLTFEQACMVTTAASPLWAIDLMGGYVAGETVLVQGPGPIGLIAVQLCKALGAERVILSGTRDERLAIGRRLGADHVVNVRKESLVARVHEITGGKGADSVLECAGGATSMQEALECVKRGGRIGVVAWVPRLLAPGARQPGPRAGQRERGAGESVGVLEPDRDQPRAEALRRSPRAPRAHAGARPPPGGPGALAAHHPRGGRGRAGGRHALRGLPGRAGAAGWVRPRHRPVTRGSPPAPAGGRRARRVRVHLQEPGDPEPLRGAGGLAGRPVETQELGALYADIRAGSFEVAADFHCSYIVEPDLALFKFQSVDVSPVNYSRYTDRVLDALYEKKSRATDREERRRHIREFERRLLDLYTFQWHRIVVHSARVRGWTITPSHFLNNQLDTVWLAAD
jgi:threonine dehydrogenase-like Zn-dependent dehydrogenase